MNVLVVAPHPDDEAIGCGGAICLHVERGDRVCVAFLTSGELGLKHLPVDEAWHIREEEAKAAARVLGLARLAFLHGPDWFLDEHTARVVPPLRALFEDERPRLIYVPHPLEWHPDHRAALPAVREALQGAGLDPVALHTYEVWTPLAEWSHVEDVSSVMRRKIDAVRCYRSQLRAFRYDRAVRGLNAYRGALAARSSYAEVFGDASAEGG